MVWLVLVLAENGLVWFDLFKFDLAWLNLVWLSFVWLSEDSFMFKCEPWTDKKNKYGSVQELCSTFGHIKYLIWFGPD